MFLWRDATATLLLERELRRENGYPLKRPFWVLLTCMYEGAFLDDHDGFVNRYEHRDDRLSCYYSRTAYLVGENSKGQREEVARAALSTCSFRRASVVSSCRWASRVISGSSRPNTKPS